MKSKEELTALKKESIAMDNEKKTNSIPEECLEKVTGSGAFDNVPTVDEHNYDEQTRIVSSGATEKTNFKP